MSRGAGAALAGRLRARLPEIESTILTRIGAVSDSRVGDPEYLLGRRASVHAGLEYALSALEGGEQGVGSIPTVLLDQAHRAARSGVSLDTVLRRYLAAHTLLLDSVLREACQERSTREGLWELISIQAILFDRLLAAVAEEHSRADAELRRETSTEARRLRTIERLLAGEALGAPDLRYQFGGFHLSLIASGLGAADQVRRLAARLDRSLLVTSPDETTLWAWLGGRRPLAPEELLAELASEPSGLRIAIGELGEGLAGWRQSHRQAGAAWPIAQRAEEAVVRYADVAILASTLRDHLLTDSLHKLYLEPLETDRDGGETLRRTLLAYFAAERSAVSAAAALGVSRQAVSRRLRIVEERIGRPLGSCLTEIETALRMGQLGHVTRRA